MLATCRTEPENDDPNNRYQPGMNIKNMKLFEKVIILSVKGFHGLHCDLKIIKLAAAAAVQHTGLKKG